MTQNRNYDQEIKDTNDHKYAYGFDYDVMHPFMIDTFLPFFREGSALELGCFKGKFTARIASMFNNLTCVEASGEALDEAKALIGDGAKFVHATFEIAKIDEQYDNIFLTHVLEHLSDPQRILQRINNEWLTDEGHSFIACPNATAASRQIAVKMGLIGACTDVTPSEREHGHHITYTLDSLEKAAVRAGLKVVHRGGIFFKALANFQWDLLLQTDIVSEEYLQGCYEVGKEYPELCSSIFLVCRKG